MPKDTPISEVGVYLMNCMDIILQCMCVHVQLAHPGVPYFMVEFDEGGSLFTRIKGRFPLQFGRYGICIRVWCMCTLYIDVK